MLGFRACVWQNKSQVLALKVKKGSGSLQIMIGLRQFELIALECEASLGTCWLWSRV